LLAREQISESEPDGTLCRVDRSKTPSYYYLATVELASLKILRAVRGEEWSDCGRISSISKEGINLRNGKFIEMPSSSTTYVDCTASWSAMDTYAENFGKADIKMYDNEKRVLRASYNLELTNLLQMRTWMAYLEINCGGAYSDDDIRASDTFKNAMCLPFKAYQKDVYKYLPLYFDSFSDMQNSGASGILGNLP